MLRTNRVSYESTVLCRSTRPRTSLDPPRVIFGGPVLVLLTIVAATMVIGAKIDCGEHIAVIAVARRS